MAQTYETEIVNAARKIARLQLKRGRLRRELRKLEQELKHEKKVMKKLVAAKDIPWDESGAASKVLGIVAGR